MSGRHQVRSLSQFYSISFLCFLTLSYYTVVPDETLQAILRFFDLTRNPSWVQIVRREGCWKEQVSNIVSEEGSLICLWGKSNNISQTENIALCEWPDLDVRPNARQFPGREDTPVGNKEKWFSLNFLFNIYKSLKSSQFWWFFYFPVIGWL